MYDCHQVIESFDDLMTAWTPSKPEWSYFWLKLVNN